MRKEKWWLYLLMPVLVLFVIFSQSPSVKAVEVGDVITRMYVTDANGTPLTGDISQWQTFRLNADFVLPDNTVNTGDTTTIKIPDEIKFGTPLVFEIKATDGSVVANAVADPTTNTMTLTYTNYTETHSGVKGSFYFNAQVDFLKVTTRKEIPLDIVVAGKVVPAGSVTFEGIGEINYSPLAKSGWQNGSDPTIVEYYLAINRTETQSALHNVKVSDILREDGVTYIDGSFRIEIGEWKYVNGDWSLFNKQNITANHPVHISGSRFTVDLGDIPEGKGVRIRYQAKLPYIPVSGEVFLNDAQMTSDEITDKTTTFRYSFFDAGGQAEGNNFIIKINKVDPSGNPLSGAVFDVIRVRSGQVVGQITTDSSGQGQIGNLLRDKYILREVTPPVGYSPAGDVEVDPSEFDDTSKSVTKDIVNHPVTTTTTTTSTTTEATTTPATTVTTAEATTTPATTVTTAEATTTPATTVTTAEATTTAAATTTTVEPTTTAAATTTTVAPATTTAASTSTVAPTTSVTTTAATTVDVPGTTTGVTPPPAGGKKGKTLPKTGEESGLTVSLVGFALMTVAGVAGVLYRKSKKA